LTLPIHERHAFYFEDGFQHQMLLRIASVLPAIDKPPQACTRLQVLMVGIERRHVITRSRQPARGSVCSGSSWSAACWCTYQEADYPSLQTGSLCMVVWSRLAVWRIARPCMVVWSRLAVRRIARPCMTVLHVCEPPIELYLSCVCDLCSRRSAVGDSLPVWCQGGVRVASGCQGGRSQRRTRYKAAHPARR